MPDTEEKVVEEIGVLKATIAPYKAMNVIMDAAHRVYVDNYNDIRNKPTINGVELRGDKHGEDYYLLNSTDEITADEVDAAISEVWK